jgi:hypothetical protein
VITDSLNPGGVTAPDAILTCTNSEFESGLEYAFAVPVGCLKLYNGEWVKVDWPDEDEYLELTQQTDGNLVLTDSVGTTSTTKWSSGTTFKGNSKGPGCLAQFQSNADLVVSNCDGASIWDSATHTYPNAVLFFQSGERQGLGALGIDETPGGTNLWFVGGLTRPCPPLC